MAGAPGGGPSRQPGDPTAEDRAQHDPAAAGVTGEGPPVAPGSAGPGVEGEAEATEEAGRLVERDLAEAVDQATLTAERDEYLETLLRVKAEFDNFKRRTARERDDAGVRAGGQVAAELLPVLDACDAAVGHGAVDVEPICKALIEALGRVGLERMAPEGAPFDPNLHDAVMHEPDDGSGGEATVTEVLRPGYVWKGQVLRAAMVKVRG